MTAIDQSGRVDSVAPSLAEHGFAQGAVAAELGSDPQVDTATYQRVLGDELRRLRKQRGWTRRDLNRRLQSDISLQTLATYEYGTRHCSVVRLVEICLALGEVPHELLARVHQRVFSDFSVDRIRIDLRKIARTTQPELARTSAAGVEFGDQ